jgi:hypothetical protein
MMLKVVIAVVLLAHSIGHSLGLLQIIKVATVNPAWRGDSWLLTGTLGATLTQVVGASIWTVAIVGFAALAAVVAGWLPSSWFTPLAIASSAISLAGIVVFPMAFPMSSTIGALTVDVVLLVAATWFRWLPIEFGA